LRSRAGSGAPAAYRCGIGVVDEGGGIGVVDAGGGAGSVEEAGGGAA